MSLTKETKEKILRYHYNRNPQLKKSGISFKAYSLFVDKLEKIIFGEIDEENNANSAEVINFEAARAGVKAEKDGDKNSD